MDEEQLNEVELWREIVARKTQHFGKMVCSTIEQNIVHKIKQHTESPIEAMLAAQLTSPFAVYVDVPVVLDAPIHVHQLRTRIEALFQVYRPVGFLGQQPSDRRMIMIFPQAEVNEFRVDFLVAGGYVPEAGGIISTSVVVECDGHEFHERTKEQAAKDRARDRKLQRYGWDVLRFTGSEIWADPSKCATEILVHLGRLLPGLFPPPQEPSNG